MNTAQKCSYQYSKLAEPPAKEIRLLHLHPTGLPGDRTKRGPDDELMVKARSLLDGSDSPAFPARSNLTKPRKKLIRQEIENYLSRFSVSRAEIGSTENTSDSEPSNNSGVKDERQHGYIGSSFSDLKSDTEYFFDLAAAVAPEKEEDYLGGLRARIKSVCSLTSDLDARNPSENYSKDAGLLDLMFETKVMLTKTIRSSLAEFLSFLFLAQSRSPQAITGTMRYDDLPIRAEISLSCDMLRSESLQEEKSNTAQEWLAPPGPSTVATQSQSQSQNILNRSIQLPPVYCSLQTVSLKERPDYIAMSYTWGDLAKCCSITLNGQTF